MNPYPPSQNQPPQNQPSHQPPPPPYAAQYETPGPGDPTGWYNQIPNQSFTPFVVYGLLAINVLMFILTGLRGGLGDTNTEVLYNHGMLFAPSVWEGQWWRLLTSMFLHGGLLHIFVNMWALRNLGEELERLYGRFGFIVLYIGAGWLGSLGSVMFSGMSVGASGAIFGLAGAYLAIALRRRVYWRIYGAQIVPVIIANLFIGFSLSSIIDNYAHIGGLIGGFLLGSVLPNALPEFRDRWRWPATLALVALFLVATPLAVNISRQNLAPKFMVQ